MRLLAAFAAACALLCAAPAAANPVISEIDTAAVTCATTATAADAGVVNTVPRQYSICLPDDATAAIYVGEADVTTSTGTKVTAGKCWSTGDSAMAKNTTPYCIVASGTQAARVTEGAVP